MIESRTSRASTGMQTPTGRLQSTWFNIDAEELMESFDLPVDEVYDMLSPHEQEDVAKYLNM